MAMGFNSWVEARMAEENRVSCRSTISGPILHTGEKKLMMNRTEWSPTRSVIIEVIMDDRAAGKRFVYHEYDYRPN